MSKAKLQEAKKAMDKAFPNGHDKQRSELLKALGPIKLTEVIPDYDELASEYLSADPVLVRLAQKALARKRKVQAGDQFHLWVTCELRTGPAPWVPKETDDAE